MGKIFENVRSFITQHAMLKDARGVVVAVSGGPDSVALLDMLARLRETASALSNLKLQIAHLDHKLRGRESAEDAEFVRQLAGRLGFSISIEASDVRAEAERSRKGIEEVAREIRYDFLLRVARETDCDRISTGHTMSDQAETFLMRLARGAGLRGLAAMRPVGPVPIPDASLLLIRPLLSITREDVEDYCRQRRLAFRIDATNQSSDYTRSRVRSDVLPALRSINPRVVESIARAAQVIRADEDALDQLAAKFLDEARLNQSRELAAYRIAALLDQPVGLRRRMIISAINRVRVRNGEEITSTHIAAVERLLANRMSGKRIELPCGLAIWREFDRLVFTRLTDTARAAEAGELSVASPQVEAGGLSLILERGQSGCMLKTVIEQAEREKQATGQDWFIAALDDEAIPDRLAVRPRRPAESALVAGQQKIKKLKNLMIDHKIPSSRRRFWPVVTTPDDRYIWSPGLPPAIEFAATDKTRRLAILRASTI
ncbi:MAG TPA: tRNA lysidine(34) synthetase TilS [Blastocatellia bacterium]|nr:tRNA lysidine(34) synthetase TilS [Blastocatellia bacterium]